MDVYQFLLLASAFVSLSSAELKLIEFENNECRCVDHTKKFVDCQFKSYPDGGVVDSQRKDSGWLKIDNSALSSGVCTATLSDKFKAGVHYLIACRMRVTGNGSWEESEGVFNRNQDGELNLVTLAPTRSYSAATSADKINLSIPVTGVTNCSFFIPGQAVRYDGALGNGSCKGSFDRSAVKEVVVVRVDSWGAQTADEPWTTTQDPTGMPLQPVIEISFWKYRPFEHPVNKPVMTLTNETRSPGDLITASCVVPKNARVVWRLGSAILENKTCDDVNWSWSFQNANCVSRLNHKVTWKDNGLSLRCQVNPTSETPYPWSRAMLLSENFQELSVAFPPRLAGVALNWTTEGHLNVTLRVAANPVPSVSWAFADGPASTANESDPGMYYIQADLSKTRTDGLILSVTLANALGTTTSQILIGEAPDTMWFMVLSGVLGGICLVLVIVVLVLVLPRWRGHTPGASPLGRKEQRGRCKAVESAIYAEVGDDVEYDDIWQPEYDDVDLPPAQPMRPPKNVNVPNGP